MAAQAYDPKIIVEQGFVGARELECGYWLTLTDGPPMASVVAEIRVRSKSGFYDFEAKYLPEEQVDLDVPADVDAGAGQRRSGSWRYGHLKRLAARVSLGSMSS